MPEVDDLDLHVEMRLRDGVDWQGARDWCRRHREGEPGNILGPSWEYAALRRLKAGRNVVQFYSDDPAKHGWPHRVVFEAQPAKG